MANKSDIVIMPTVVSLQLNLQKKKKKSCVCKMKKVDFISGPAIVLGYLSEQHLLTCGENG